MFVDGLSKMKGGMLPVNVFIFDVILTVHRR